MLAVISPSKTQDFSTPDIREHTFIRQLNESELLIKLLKNKSQNELTNLMSISEKLAKLNYDRFQNFSTPFNFDNAKQALLAFKGDVYNGIDVANLSKQDLQFAQNNLRMLSGLYGVIRPLDLIAPYRLEMGTKLSNSKGKNLYEFWGDKISLMLNQDETEVIINLASNEYFKGIQQQALKAKIINIVFKEFKGDKYKIIGIYAKRARGLMVQYIIKNRIENPQDLKAFTMENYRFRADISDSSIWIFTRG
jgi:cytoplasmic iron level regulating protein YaaA (DUF328/UPF0246 family)